MALKKLVRPFEIKSLEKDGTFTGYGSVIDVKDYYGDIVIKGAFAKSLDEWKAKGALPPMLWQHDAAEPIGTYSKMQEDDHGLMVEGRILLEAGPVEQRAYQHVKAGSVRGLSIGYSIAPGGLEYDKAQDAYLLKQLNLWEVSPVTFPANDQAEIGTVKSAIDGGPKEFERFLRDAGLSRSQAKGLMARGFDSLRELRDADDEDGIKDAVNTMQKTLDTMRGLRAKESK